MKKLTQDELQDMSAFVYEFVSKSLTASLEEQTVLGDTTREVIKLAASASSIAAAATYTYLEQLEGGKRIR